jgi:uncharacterized protein involved in outer membrane biogenesis
VSGDLDIGLGARPSVRGTIQASHVDLDSLLASFAEAKPPSPRPTAAPTAAQAAAPKPPDKTARVIPDNPIDFGILGRQDADVRVNIAALQTGGVTYSDIAGHLVLQDGRLVLDPFAGVTPGGRLEARLAIDSSAAAPLVAVALHAPAIALQPIAVALGDPYAVSGTAFIDADLHGAGRSPHAIAASLDGRAALAVADGEVSNQMLGLVLGDVLKAAKLPDNLVNGVGNTRLHCLAVRLDASHGVVTLPTLVADATRLLVEGGGTLDLGPETLALRLRPMLRTGPGIVVPVRIGGTFRNPKAAVDLEGKNGLLAALSAGEHGGDVCGPALAAARGGEAPVATSAAAAAAAAAPSPPAKPAKPPKPIDILRSLLQH